MARAVEDQAAREVGIEAAALRLFVRHGFRKVRMGEIAAAYGVSRPTLYAAFPNKEAVLASIIRRHTRDMLAVTGKALEARTDPRDRLQYIFDTWLIDPYAAVIDSENAADLSDSAPAFAPEATREMWAAIEGQVAAALRAGATKGRQPEVAELTHVLVTAVEGAKAVTRSLPELRRVVRGLIGMALAGLGKVGS